MKLHAHVKEKLIYLSTNYGGHQDERRLIAKLEELRLSPYFGDSIGVVLVDTERFLSELHSRKQDISHVIPMKLHASVIQKFISLYDIFSGHSNQTKLRQAINDFDLTPYERKETGETVLVLTTDYVKVLQGNK